MTPYYDEGGITIYHGECREILPELDSVDLVVTDPPYVFGIASTAQEGKAGGWPDLMNAAAWYAIILRELHRLTLARQGAAWVFNSWRSFPVLARASYEARWPIESLLVWDKEWIGPGGTRGLRPSYEVAALFVHEGFAIPDRGVPDLWRAKWAGAKQYHPAEKPVPLLSRILRESGCVPTAERVPVVLDPFMGSGSTLVSAKQTGVRAIGIELEERHCETAVRRLAQGGLFNTEVSA